MIHNQKESVNDINNNNILRSNSEIENKDSNFMFLKTNSLDNTYGTLIDDFSNINSFTSNSTSIKLDLLDDNSFSNVSSIVSSYNKTSLKDLNKLSQICDIERCNNSAHLDSDIYENCDQYLDLSDSTLDSKTCLIKLKTNNFLNEIDDKLIKSIDILDCLSEMLFYENTFFISETKKMIDEITNSVSYNTVIIRNLIF